MKHPFKISSSFYFQLPSTQIQYGSHLSPYYKELRIRMYECFYCNFVTEVCALGEVDFWIFFEFQFPTVCSLWEKQFED
jgi:hypothetical protein